MLKFKHTTLIIIAGALWMAVGIFLMNIGLKFIATSALPAHMGNGLLLERVSPYLGGIQETAALLMGVSMIVGYFKGRFVLGKTVQRMVERICSLQAPVPLHHLYGIKFYILIALMVGLGLLMRFLNLPLDARGMVDVAIGTALINGAVLYFRKASVLRKEEKRFL